MDFLDKILNVDLLVQVIIVAIAGGCVTTLTIQMIKQLSSKKWVLYVSSILVSAILGTLFAHYFSDLEWVYCAWVGLFTWLDADALYKMLEDKIKLFSSYSKIHENDDKVIKLERKDNE